MLTSRQHICFEHLRTCWFVGFQVRFSFYNYFHPIFTIFISVSKFNAVACTGSTFTLSLDRYIPLVRSLKCPKVMTLKRTISLVACTWAAAIFVVIFAMVDLVGKIKPFLLITRYFLGFYLFATIVMYVYMYNLGRKHVTKTGLRCHGASTSKI